MKHRLCVLMALLGLAFNASAASLGTAFTYQGRLNDGGAPANGLYDIRVSLYSHPTDEILAETAPSQNPYGIIGVGVTNGLFTTPLDFGPNAFNGPPRWLEIWVRTNFAGFWTVLTPRQELKPTPYALYATQAGLAGYATSAGIAGHAPWAGLTGLPTGFADGGDNDTIYLAGFGLALSGTTFSLNLSQTDARYWTTVGNGGPTLGTHFLGNTIGTAKPLLGTAGAVPWQVTPYVAGTGEDARLRIAVNGAPGQGNIRWVASVYSTELMR